MRATWRPAATSSPRTRGASPTALSGHGRACGTTSTRRCTGWTSRAGGSGSPAGHAEHGREGECAVAFSLNADVDSAGGGRRSACCARLFADEPRPDLILLETLSVLGDALDDTVQALLDTGLPVWLSFRRCRHGLCGVYGQHWGGPEGDAFGRAAHRFEGMGVGALLINCIPPDHADGMVSYLRDFTDLPLGVYPNLGYFTDRGWSFDVGVGGEEYAEMALRWREEGAQIVGGCCGVRPEHVAAARERLEGTKPGHTPRRGRRRAQRRLRHVARCPPPPPWTDRRRRTLFPLPFPELDGRAGRVHARRAEPHDVALPVPRGRSGRTSAASTSAAARGCSASSWPSTARRTCCAVDIDQRAVANTLGNAFRNGVADRVTAAGRRPLPVGPRGALRGHRREPLPAADRPLPAGGQPSPGRLLGSRRARPADRKLPKALAPEGVAYVVQFSIALAAAHGRAARGRRLRRPGRRLRAVRRSRPASTSRRSRSAASSSSPTPTTCASASTTLIVAYLLEIRHDL